MITIIPLIDDFLQMFIVNKLKWLKEHPAIIDHIFYSGRRETLEKLKEFVTSRKLKVVIGYPRDQSSLPAYVITLAPEQEQPSGLGDNFETYDSIGFEDEDDDDITEKVENELAAFVSSTFMNANYRIECWSDNGDLTSYMYVILKWCLWTSRMEMLNLGWTNIKLSGTDLEPVPDYMPVFIYRRSAQIAVTYDNLYYEDISTNTTEGKSNMETLGQYLEVIDHPDDYHEDENGNIVDKDGDVVVPCGIWQWILKPHYYEKTISVEEKGGSQDGSE